MNNHPFPNDVSQRGTAPLYFKDLGGYNKKSRWNQIRRFHLDFFNIRLKCFSERSRLMFRFYGTSSGNSFIQIGLSRFSDYASKGISRVTAIRIQLPGNNYLHTTA